MTDEVTLTDSDVSEDDWLLAIGRVVIAASAAEHELGELILAARDSGSVTVKESDAAQSGDRLVRALGKITAAKPEIEPLVAKYKEQLERRNSLVHGSWMLSPFKELPTITAKRNRTSPRADLEGFVWELSDLAEMAASFESLRAGARKITDELQGFPRRWSALEDGTTSPHGREDEERHQPTPGSS